MNLKHTDVEGWLEKDSLQGINKKNPNVQGPPAVMVRFTNRKARDAVYAARQRLKTCQDPVFINEDLTKSAAKLFSQARKLVKEKAVYKAWTNMGSVFIKVNDHPATKPKLVCKITDLPMI
jgi:hypothetical protein